MRSHITSWIHAHAPEIGWLVIFTAYLALVAPQVAAPMFALAVAAVMSVRKE